MEYAQWLLASANEPIMSGLLAAAAPGFPRGPGFYFSLVKIGFFIAGFGLWIYVCNAVQRDSDVVEMHVEKWNAVMLGLGILGLLMIWFCPSFWISLFGMAVMTICGVGAYAFQRNKHTPLPIVSKIKGYLQSEEE